MRTPVLMNWKANNTFGWGIAGLNIFFHWANDPSIQPLMQSRIDPQDVQMVDPMRLAVTAQAVNTSNAFVAQFSGKYSSFDFPIIDALGNGLKPPNELRGSQTIARAVFEDTHMPDLANRLAKYDVIVCASRWNRDLLSDKTGKRVEVIHEGVDHSLFFPGPRSGLLPQDRFFVYTGGKVEFRKAQDLVLLAFKAFSDRHPDAVLVTSWHSPWPAISAGFRGKTNVELKLGDNGRLDVIRWAVENGIRPECVMDIGPIPNPMMPHVMREMDCALQPSRAEGGTNIVCKEAMACGLPVILGMNTGVVDLVSKGNCVPLLSQRAVTPPGTEDGVVGWGESSVDEIVAALEKMYDDKRARRAIGKRGAEWIVENGRTWSDHAAKLKDLILDKREGYDGK